MEICRRLKWQLPLIAVEIAVAITADCRGVRKIAVAISADNRGMPWFAVEIAAAICGCLPWELPWQLLRKLPWQSPRNAVVCRGNRRRLPPVKIGVAIAVAVALECRGNCRLLPWHLLWEDCRGNCRGISRHSPLIAVVLPRQLTWRGPWNMPWQLPWSFRGLTWRDPRRLPRTEARHVPWPQPWHLPWKRIAQWKAVALAVETRGFPR